MKITQQFIAGSLTVGTLLAGISFMPLMAQANNGLPLGVDTNVNAQVNMHKDKDHDDEKDSLHIQDSTFISAVNSARVDLRQAVKAANTDFKTAKKLAKVELKAAVKASNNPSDRTTALKTYFASVLAAFKIKAVAVEAAFQTFLNTHFEN